LCLCGCLGVALIECAPCHLHKADEIIIKEAIWQ
jgi:hypothetical protein